MGDANPLLHHCMENILLNGSVNLNIDKDPRKCRAIFRELSGVLNKKLILDSVKSIVLPTNNFTSEEEDIILCIIFMKNVEVCTLCGGRRGSDGKAKQGGLQNLPRNFGSLTQITHLDLSFNIFTNMPECLFVLENLNTLNLDFNHIKTIPPEIHKLSNLEELYFRRNNLSSINVKISCLQCLKILNISSNQLNELPNVFHLMKSLRSLDFSNNRIGQLPENLFCSDSLDTIRAGHNYVETLPPGLCDSNVEIVDVRFNCIVELDDSVKSDNRVLLKGNLPKSNRNHDSSLDDIEVNDYDVPIYVMESDISSFSTSSEGCYELPSGVRITIPKHFTCSCNEIYCNVFTYEDCNFSLQETDQLLSVVLHLMPNGLHFEKPIKISIPYTFSGFDDQKREIVIRVVSSDSKNYSEDLRSDIINHHEEPPSTMHGEVTALIAHFSKFAVVSRLVQNTIVVDKNSQKTLFSSVDPFTKLRFPEGCVTSDVNVTLQILSVNPMDVDNITASSNSYASNILSVDVKPSTEFKQPITVHLALPYLLMGKQFNKRELRLMKCKNDSEEWKDITENVDLVFSTVDVSFQVQSFSKFWLVWSNVCGVLRKVYRRIITYDVQFLAMQVKLFFTVHNEPVYRISTVNNMGITVHFFFKKCINKVLKRGRNSRTKWDRVILRCLN
ncbi:unnamed protein product [Clavelina lepadiformis]|uniref:Leucine-rich repeat protein SHOC-2 n=1 Tax=Clavelina lepadiformis TaxID=159417 RepID=A0ABP0F4G0_CLALP